MKALHVSDYPVDSGGGAEVHIGQVVDLLRGRGVDVRTFTSADLADPRLTPWRYINNAPARRRLAGLLDEVQPDVVHLHNFYHVLSPGILAELARWRRRRSNALRIVMTAHDYHLLCPNSGGTWFDRSAAVRVIDPERVDRIGYLTARRWDRRGLGHSIMKLAQHLWSYRVRRLRSEIDLVICPSQFVERMMRRAGMKTIRLPHPAPAFAQRAREGDGPDVGRQRELRLVFAGRIEPEKGLAEFLEILPQDLALHMTVIGDGSELGRCRGIVAQRSWESQVSFTGRLPHDRAIALIAQSNVLVLPSLCLENYPMSLVEALAAGVNILASNLGGMREIVDESGVGFLFAPGDQRSLVAAIDRIRTALDRGLLNSFDVSNWLQERSETRYAESLIAAYQTPSAYTVRA